MGVLPPTPSCCQWRFHGHLCQCGAVPYYTELEEELGMLSGTITTTFSLQIQAELLLASPPLLASHCFLDLPLFPCQDQHCLPAAWLGAQTRWALLGMSEPAAALRGLGLPWVGAATSAAPFSPPELCWGPGWALGTRSCGLWCKDASKLLLVLVLSRGPPRPRSGFGLSCWDRLELSLWQPLPQDGDCFVAKLGRYGWVFFCREGRCH